MIKIKSLLLLPRFEEREKLQINAVNDADTTKLVKLAGYDETGWQCLGSFNRKRNGDGNGNERQIIKFLRLGRRKNIQEAREMVELLGYKMAEGQAAEKIISAYRPPTDDNLEIILGGTIWMNPRGKIVVPYVKAFEITANKKIMAVDFQWAHSFGDNCLWAVVENHNPE